MPQMYTPWIHLAHSLRLISITHYLNTGHRCHNHRPAQGYSWKRKHIQGTDIDRQEAGVNILPRHWQDSNLGMIVPNTRYQDWNGQFMLLVAMGCVIEMYRSTAVGRIIY